MSLSHEKTLDSAPDALTAPDAIADAQNANEPGARAVEPEKLERGERVSCMVVILLIMIRGLTLQSQIVLLTF